MKTFQIFMYFIIAFTFIACGNNKNGVQFEILNKNLYYFHNNNERVRNYNSESERDKSFNLVKYKLTNNSNKKMLFIINSFDLIDVYGLTIKVKEGDKFLKGANVLSHNLMDNCTECYFTSMDEVTKLDSYKLGKLGAKGNFNLFKKYRLQSVILNPDESRIFTSLISLPCVIEDNRNTLTSYYGYKFKKDENYKFSMEYNLDKKSVLKCLNSTEIENLKSNEIELFEGKITSNEINLIPRE